MKPSSPVVVAFALGALLFPSALVAAQTPEPPTLSVGGEISGVLTADGPSFLDLGPFVAHRFRGDAGQWYVADARSEDFDAYLILARPVGGITEVLDEDDDGGDGTDARLRFRIEEPGEYLLVVRSWSGDARGAFTLALDEWELPPPAEPRTLPVGETVTGRLTAGSSHFLSELDDLIPYELWTFEGEGDERYLISLESDEFDPYLDFGPLSEGELMVEQSDDDGGEGTNALLVVTLPHDGVFGIRARAFSSGMDPGSYRLRVEPFVPAPAVRRPISSGSIEAGRLELGGPMLPDVGLYQEWVYTGNAGERLRIRMRSDEFDPYLALGRDGADGAFEELTSNDDAPDDGLNSLIEFTLPSDGEYVIRAHSFSSGSTGGYTLEIQSDR